MYLMYLTVRYPDGKCPVGGLVGGESFEEVVQDLGGHVTLPPNQALQPMQQLLPLPQLL